MTHFCFCKSSAHLSQPIFPNESHEPSCSNEWEAQDGPGDQGGGGEAADGLKLLGASFFVMGLALCFPLKSKVAQIFQSENFSRFHLSETEEFAA